MLECITYRVDNIHKGEYCSLVKTVLGGTTFTKGGHYSLENNVSGDTSKRGHPTL